MNEHNENQDDIEMWTALFESSPVNLTPREDHQMQLRNDLLGISDGKRIVTLASRTQINTERIGTKLMRYKIPHLTATAGILIALFAISFTGSTTASALDAAISQLVKAKSASWDLEIRIDDTVSKSKVSWIPDFRRQDNVDGSYTVVELSSANRAIFNPGKKSFLFVAGGTTARGSKIEILHADLIRRIKDGGKHVKSLGKRDFSGKTLQGFQLFPSQDAVIWIDSETELPVRIELLAGPNGDEPFMILKNYRFNVEFEEGFFSMAQPEGYRNPL